MLKKLRLITSVSILALLVQSCGLFQSSEENANTSQSPTPAVTPPPPTQPKTPAFAKPTQPATAPNSVSVGGLIPSTDPAQRTKEIKQGRQNPFTVIPVQPIIKSGPISSPPTPPKPTVGKQPKLPAQPSAKLPPKPIPKLPPSPPPIPEPNEARGVVVSGVIQVGGIPVAILQAPGEAVARQVTPGTRLANGQVLVKGIDMSREIPVVILEQYGIQVYKAVGAKPEVASATAPK